MKTRCPRPECKKIFDLPDERAGKSDVCPFCTLRFSVRPLEILEKIELETTRRKELVQKLSAETIENGASRGAELAGLMAILEDVRSLWNVGSIFRTAAGAGFQQLYLCGITGCPPRKEIAKTSLGAEDVIAWEYVQSTLEVLPTLKSRGVFILGLEKTETSVDLSGFLNDERNAGKFSLPLCVVLGNEVSGVSAEALSYCDVVCHLPMRGIKESLNVAVAFGIASYLVSECMLSKKLSCI